MGFSQNIKTFLDCLSNISGADDSKVYDFSKTRANYYKQTGRTKLAELKKEIISLTPDVKDLQKTSELLQLLEKIEASYGQRPADEIKKLVDKLVELYASIDMKSADQAKIFVNLPEFPGVISSEVKADLEELKRCFDSKCYRASTILCGRILEIALHHLYFEKTNIDLLETSPGLGLGKIIAKLYEKGIDLGPGINEQIHLINNVRINSVHMKKDLFTPSKEQTHAMILYTVDILNKVFKKG